ncbi:hypothetical protein J5X84_02785 [Streptosporangiaceae bacterium NEAU-GS5]|nr:hypothetical protein [Streptosporangiaceae bacterium NEAU-GS5]
MTRVTPSGTVRITLPAGSVDRLAGWAGFARRNAVPLAALVLLVLQLWWRAEVVSLAYFKDDDFDYAARAVENGLSWDYLTRVHYGQFMPVGFALAWLTTRAAPYSWGFAAGTGLVLFTLSGVAVYRMLVVLFGRRPAVLVPLAVYLFVPFTLPALTWWSAALNVAPLLLAIPMAISEHVLHLRTGRRLHAVLATVWILVGLGSFLKAVALPLLLFALTAAYFSAGWRDALRRHAFAWSLYGSALAVWAVVYVIGARTTHDMTGWPSLSDGVGFVKRLLFDTFVPSLLGGPWRWFSGLDKAVAAPPALLVWTALAVAVLLLVVTVRHRRHGGRAWALLFGYLLVADVVPVYYGRVHVLGAFEGMETRYVSDAAPVLALAIGLALLPLRGEAEPYRRILSREALSGAGGLLLGGFVVGSLASINLFSSYLGNPGTYAYLGHARNALRAAPADAVILDRLAPGEIVKLSDTTYDMTSHVVAPLATAARRETLWHPAPSADALVFNDRGDLVRAEVLGERVKALGGCFPSAGSDVTIPVPPTRGSVVRVGYSSSSEQQVILYVGDRAYTVRIHEGLGRILIPARPAQVRFAAPPAGVCFGDVTAGDPVAT